MMHDGGPLVTTSLVWRVPVLRTSPWRMEVSFLPGPSGTGLLLVGSQRLRPQIPALLIRLLRQRRGVEDLHRAIRAAKRHRNFYSAFRREAAQEYSLAFQRQVSISKPTVLPSAA